MKYSQTQTSSSSITDVWDDYIDISSEDDFEFEFFDELNQTKHSLQRLLDQVDSSQLSTLSVLFENSFKASNSVNVSTEVEQDYLNLLKQLPWAYDFYTSAKDLDTPKKLVPFYQEINKLVHFSSVREIDDFLFYVETEHMSDVLLPGLLRLTSTKKSDLKYWKVLKERVKVELLSRGYDSEKLLKGLD